MADHIVNASSVSRLQFHLLETTKWRPISENNCVEDFNIDGFISARALDISKANVHPELSQLQSQTAILVNQTLGISSSLASYFEESGPLSIIVSTMELFQALLANGNLHSASIILQQLPHDLLLFIIKIAFLPSTLRTAFYDVLMALHLTVHKNDSSDPFYLLSLQEIRDTVSSTNGSPRKQSSVTHSRILSRKSPSRSSTPHLDEVSFLWTFVSSS